MSKPKGLTKKFNPKKTTIKGIKRVIKGWEGISKQELNTARKNIIFFAKKSSAVKAVKEMKIENEFHFEIEKILKQEIESGKIISLNHFKSELKEKGLKLLIALNLKYALDSVNEFNPEKRRYIKKQIEKIRNAIQRNDVISVHAGINAQKEIERTLGETRTNLFLANASKKGKKLKKMLDKLTENPPIEEALKQKNF